MNSKTQNAAGVWHRQGKGDVAYRTFMPDALPPALSFDADLVGTLSRADRALGELAGLGHNIPNPQLLLRPFVRREAVLSSRIEGTQTGIADLYAYEAGQEYTGNHRGPTNADAQEVLNYVHALEYSLERIKTLPLSLRLLREIHARLMAGVRGGAANPGEFRQPQNWIGSPGCTLSTARFVPPAVPDMHDALGQWENYLHQENHYPPLVRLAFIHYQFEAIHPFLDGNGRMGRLLISLLLVHWKLLPLPLLYLSAYFERQRQHYYDLLLAVSERGEWHNWTLFFLEGVAQQARDANARAMQLQNLQQAWRQRLVEERAAASLLRLADGLFDAPIMTVPQAQQMLGATYNTARAAVGKLVSAGILQPLPQPSYGKAYVAADVLKIVEQDQTSSP